MENVPSDCGEEEERERREHFTGELAASFRELVELTGRAAPRA